MSEAEEPTKFQIRVDGGEEMTFTARTGVYSLAVLPSPNTGMER